MNGCFGKNLSTTGVLEFLLDLNGKKYIFSISERDSLYIVTKTLYDIYAKISPRSIKQNKKLLNLKGLQKYDSVYL